ncbi:hypothetical protein DFH09DRAFT_1132002 [Mycena vulgaris]|nr:hypothetical protein DFH09DRAFT_1132002 [Mycena vulgaris]
MAPPTLPISGRSMGAVFRQQAATAAEVAAKAHKELSWQQPLANGLSSLSSLFTQLSTGGLAAISSQDSAGTERIVASMNEFEETVRRVDERFDPSAGEDISGRPRDNEGLDDDLARILQQQVFLRKLLQMRTWDEKKILQFLYEEEMFARRQAERSELARQELEPIHQELAVSDKVDLHDPLGVSDNVGLYNPSTNKSQPSLPLPDSSVTDEIDSTLRISDLDPPGPPPEYATPMIPERRVSTFIIYTPAPSIPIDAPAFDTEEMPDGGSLSTHSPDAAVAWVEAHFNHPYLAAIRARGLGGPIAAMLDQFEQGLVIFGSILDDWILDAASSLSDLSKFSVMVQPRTHDPVYKWAQETSAANPIANFNTRAEQRPEISDGASTETDEGASDIDTRSRSFPDVVIGQGPARRLRGGAGSDSESDAKNKPWTSDTHELEHMVQLKDAAATQIWIESDVTFRVQTEYEKKDRKDRRPQVISTTRLYVHGGRGRVGSPDGELTQVSQDRSYSSIGFLINAHHITKSSWIDEGFGKPGQTYKTVRTEGKETHLTGSLTGSARPAGKIEIGRKWAEGESNEAQNNKPTPNWIVAYRAGQRLEEPNSQNIRYDSYDIAYEEGLIASAPNQRADLDVTLSMGINIATRKDGKHVKTGKLPKVSFIVRHQIMVWIASSTLQAKGQGLLILSAFKIPDVKAEQGWGITDSKVVDPTNISESVPVVRNEIPTQGGHFFSSLSMGVVPTLPAPAKSSLLKKAFRKLTGRKPPQVVHATDLPLYEIVSRGWDANQSLWRTPVRPILDSSLRDIYPEELWNVTTPGLDRSDIIGWQVNPDPVDEPATVPNAAETLAQSTSAPEVRSDSSTGTMTSVTSGSTMPTEVSRPESLVAPPADNAPLQSGIDKGKRKA